MRKLAQVYFSHLQLIKILDMRLYEQFLL